MPARTAPSSWRWSWGYRESTGSWAPALRALRERGLAEASLLAVDDGALGQWTALTKVFPTSGHQRCWDHKAMTVLDRLPKRLQPEARRHITAIWSAPTRAASEAEWGRTVTWLQGRGRPTPPRACCATGTT